MLGRLSDEEADAVLPELRGARDRLREELAATDGPPSVITLHPTAMRQYLATIDRLGETLAAHIGADDDRGPLVAEFRSLIRTVTVHRRPGSELYVEVKGRLAALIGGDAFPNKVGDAW